jgi:transcriptional regulator with XRE-family HTH domain
MSNLAHRIREARRSAGLSQAALATAVGVGRSAVAQWERPEGSRPTSTNLATLSVITEVNFDWLATGRGARRLASEPTVPALLLKFSAQCGLEERLLAAFRRLRSREQVALLALMEVLPDHGALRASAALDDNEPSALLAVSR